MKSGFIPGLPFANYALDGGLNHSKLKLFDKSPAHYALAQNGNDEDSGDYAFGRAYHTYVLEPRTFARDYLITKKITRRGEVWEKLEMQAAAENKEILWEEDFEHLKGMRRALSAHSLIPGIFDGSDRELTVFWEMTDPSPSEVPRNYRCKARLDLYNKPLHILADLKSTSSAHPKDFQRSIFDYDYHTQAEWYLRAWASAQPARKPGESMGPPPNFIFIAQEKESPYLISLHEMIIDTLAFAQRENDDRLRKFFACSAAGQFPGYEEIPNKIYVPDWKMKQLA